jgi:endoglucanase
MCRFLASISAMLCVAVAGAATPADIAKASTPAHRLARQFLRGANFGNYLEAPPNSWGNIRYTAEDFARARAEGFDHVRLPVAWHHYAGAAPDFALSPEIFAKVDFLVTNATAHGLAAIVNIHHFDAFTSDPAAHKAKFLALWRQIAAHYARAPASVAFELLNEPKDAATTTVMNPIYAEAIALIRRAQPERLLLVGPGKWNSLDELPALRLPEDDRLLVTVHCYEPFLFTHQGASWAGRSPRTRGIVFPGPPPEPVTPASGIEPWATNWIERYNTRPAAENPSGPTAFAAKFKAAKAWAEQQGRPIHLGEFGCYQVADAASRARYYAAMRATAEAHGFGWAVWDWKAGFKYWDDQADRPAPGMREALFPGKP